MALYQKKLNASSEYNVKDVDTVSRVISVYYSAFGNKDRDGDVIVKGAFLKTIREQGPQGIGEIWHLINHNPNMHVATPRELFEDSYGVLSRVEMPNTKLGDDTLELYQKRHYKLHSIGYLPIRQQKRSDHNEISEIRMMEGSSVLWPANPAAGMADNKSYFDFFTMSELEEECQMTVKDLRNGKYSDETFRLLEIKLRQLYQALADKSTLAVEKTPEPPKDELDYSGIIKALNNINNNFKSI